MEYVYAALLLHAAKQPVNEENVAKVLGSSGMQVDQARVKALVSSLQGVNIEEAIKQAAMPVAAPAQAAAPAAKAEEKKEEKKPTAEEAAAGLSALFG
ncbi:50S ribosomal protein P1 [Candidatus Micrarchaeota archaeon]|nr:50S ribosomal protein P1 [Candidatus Micrarchaeota archaeon]